MSWITRMRNSLLASISTFRETYVSAGDDASALIDFNSYQGRRLRYSLYRALYDTSVYRATIHQWSPQFRQQYGLYRYIRAVEAPTVELVTFWQTHLFGGALDMDAGDGRGTPSAIPILTDTEALRPAIAQIWQWSNWATKKDTYALVGARDGDVAVRIIDDVRRKKVYFRVDDPSTFIDVAFDPFGNVCGYTREEVRAHPITGKACTYKEHVCKDGDAVLYQTFLDEQSFAWPGNEDVSGTPRAAWQEPYGFVPMVFVNHIDTNTEFGLSELHAGLPLFRELDDIASALDDQIRKSVNAPWLLAGVEDPKLKRGGTDPRIHGATATATNTEPGRQEVPMFYGPAGATATPLLASLDLAGVNSRIEALHAGLRSRYPELDADIATAAGDASGRALRVARQAAETKVNLRRAAYDDALVRAQQMAVAIAGFRRLPDFASFGLDSYAAGALDHRIGSRPVFAVSTADAIEEDAAFWAAAKVAKDAGADLAGYLEDKGWNAQRIALVAPKKPVPPPLMGGVHAVGTDNPDQHTAVPMQDGHIAMPVGND